MGIAFVKPDGESSELGRDASDRLLDFVVYAVSQSDAEATLWSQAPPLYMYLPIQSVGAKLKVPGQLYDGTVKYATPKRNKDVGTTSWEMDTTGGKVKVLNSIETVHIYPVPGTITLDFKGAINVTDKSVDGTEIVAPSLKFSITSVLEFDDVTVAEFAKLLASLTGTVNDSEFLGFDEGELLFTGGNLTTQKDSENQPGVSVKWNFEAQQNATDLQLGGGMIKGIAKDGWDYLWTYYVDQPDPVAQMLAKRMLGAYVERVYPRADFSQLNIPDPDNYQGYQ